MSTTFLKSLPIASMSRCMEMCGAAVGKPVGFFLRPTPPALRNGMGPRAHAVEESIPERSPSPPHHSPSAFFGWLFFSHHLRAASSHSSRLSNLP